MIRALERELQARLHLQRPPTVAEVQDALAGTVTFDEALQQATDSDVAGCVKDAGKAAALRSQGNAAFQRGEHGAAAAVYSDALRWAPIHGPNAAPAAAKLYSNRALALFKLGSDAAVKHADQDCTVALQLDASSLKALFRRATARQALGHHAAAMAAIDAAVALATAAADQRTLQDLRSLRERMHVTAGRNVGDPAAMAPPAWRQADTPILSGTVPANALGSDVTSIKVSGHKPGKCHASIGLATTAEPLQPPTGPKLEALNRLLHCRALRARARSAEQQQQQQQQQCHVAVQYSAQDGRHVVASAPIAPGTDLLVDSPLASVLLKRQRRTRCWVCFKRLGPWPYWCTGCPQAVYCSLACQGSDAHHQPGSMECGLPWPSLLPEEVLLALRLLLAEDAAASADTERAAGTATATATATDMGTAHAPQAPALHTTGSPAAPQAQGAAQLARSLESHVGACCEKGSQDVASAAGCPGGEGTAAGPSQQWPLLACLAAAICCRLASADATAPASTPLDQQAACTAAAARPLFLQQRHQVQVDGSQRVCDPEQVLAALGRIAANGVAVRPAASSSEHDRVALALYPVVSLLNHSCRPNCSMRFDGSTVVIRSVAPIAAGEQLTLSYGPQVGEMPAATRQKLLWQQYSFRCRCSACVHPDEAMETIAAGLACFNKGCKGALLPPYDVPEGLIGKHPIIGNGRCNICSQSGGEAELAQAMERLHAAAVQECEACEILTGVEQQQKEEAEQRGQQKQQQQQLRRALALLRDVLACRAAVLHRSNLLLGQMQHDLASAAALAAGLNLDTSTAASVDGDVVQMGFAFGQQCSIGSSTTDTSKQALLQESIAATRSSLATLSVHYGTSSTAVAFEGQRLALLLLEASRASQDGSTSDMLRQEAQAVLQSAGDTLHLYFDAIA